MLEYKIDLYYSDGKPRATLQHCATEQEFFDSIIYEFAKVLEDTYEWRSKYNDYIIYDYAPFAINGFNLARCLEFKTEQHYEFFLFMLNKRIDRIKEMELALVNIGSEELNDLC